MNREKEKEIIDNNYIFSKEKVNNGHQPEIDYLKSTSVVLMIITHVYLEYNMGIFYYIMVITDNILTASTFMFLMGIGMKYSRHHEPKNYIFRGIILLTLGQHFYLIRDSLPNLIAWWITGNKNFVSRAMLAFQVDILSFAGFSFILIGLLNIMKFSDTFILIIGIFMNIFNIFFFKCMKSPNNYLLSQFIGFFLLTNADAYFPLFSYFIFVAFGYWIGGYYQKMLNKDKFYNLVLIFCSPIVVIFIYLRITENIPFLSQFTPLEIYCLMPGHVGILYCMDNLTLLAICYKIHKMLKGKTPEIITHIAKNLNQYYTISYSITIQVSIFLKVKGGENAPSEMKYPTLFSFLIFIVCRILIDMSDKYIHYTISTLKNSKRNFVFALIWIISIIIVIYTYPKIEVFANMWNDYLK